MSNVLFFLLGSLVTFLLSPWFKEALERWRRRPSWDAFMHCLKDSEVLDYCTKLTPDVIIGVNNGIVAASVLATNFGIENLFYFNVYPELDADSTRKDPKCPPIPIELASKRILIVDDQLYTGRTMDAVYRHVLAQPGVRREMVARLALFRSILVSARFELKSPGRLSGSIRRVPWSLTSEHARRGQHDQEASSDSVEK